MMKDFSGLALPPLFGEHILEAELEPGGVELGPGEVMLRLTSVRESSSAAKSLKHRIQPVTKPNNQYHQQEIMQI